jgi:hypothetical protein
MRRESAAVFAMAMPVEVAVIDKIERPTLD